MEPQINEPESIIAPLKKITPVSKYLAMALFVALPFLGGYIGYQYAPEKVVEIETEVIKEVEKIVEVPVQVQSTTALKLPFGSIEGAKKYLDGTSGLSDEILNKQYVSDILVDNVGPRLPGERYSVQIMAEHDTVNDCWIIQNNRVYDITGLLPLKTLFPALEELEDFCGEDVTEFINDKPVIPGSLNTARFGYSLAQFFIGALVE